MTRTELLELIKNGEGSGVEFDLDTLDAYHFAKEVVAFANFRGGRILLGVNDRGEAVGITRPDLEQWVMQVCRDKVRPEIIPFYETVTLEAGRVVAVVHVLRGLDVHHVWHNNHRYYFVRVGSTSREASQEELRRLFQQRGQLRFDLHPVSGATLSDLDLRRLHNYFLDIRGQEAPDLSDPEQWTTLLLNTEILVEADNRAVPSLGGLLLFGRNPKRFLPQSGISAAAYPTPVKDYATSERAVLRGPMVPLLDRNGEVVEAGLVEQALAFVHRNTRVEGWVDEGGRRVERRAYPDEAVREVIVNALVHRDYTVTGTDIELSIYPDRLEVISPGQLPNTITVQRMRAGCRATRNELIKEIMRDYRYIEHMGMGIPYKVIRGMRQHNGTDPDLVEQEMSFLVRLWAKGSEAGHANAVATDRPG